MILIEIDETSLDKLSREEYTVFAEMTGIPAELKALYAQRSQLIKDLGILNTKITKIWTEREK